MWRLRSKTAPDEPKPPTPGEREKLLAKHKWLGQGYCSQCGSELKTEEVSHRSDYDPFTGQALGRPVKVLWCPELRHSYFSLSFAMSATPPPLASAISIWLSPEHLASSHDFWFYGPE